MCARLRSNDRVMPGHWEATSLRRRQPGLPSACWLSAPVAWSAARRWKTPPPPRPWRASLPKLNSIAAPLRQSFTYDQVRKCRHQSSAPPPACACTSAIHTVRGNRYLREHHGLLRQYLPRALTLDLQPGRTRCHRRQPQQRPRATMISFAIRGVRTYARKCFDNFSFVH